MPTLQLRTLEQALQRMATRLVARTTLTDLNDSSDAKQELAAVAREIDDIYYQFTRLTDLFDLNKAAGDDLDERAREIQPGTITRLGPRKSIGTVVFSRSTNTGQTLVIPTGTIIKTADGKAFTTTASAQITAVSPEITSGHGIGRDSNPVSAIATVAGSSGNVGTGAVLAFQSKPPGVSEVTNITAFSLGQDKEEDDDFRARIRAFISTLARSTVQALEFVVIDVEDSATGQRVVFSHVFEDPIDRGNVIVYVDDGAGTAETVESVVSEVVLASALGGEEFLGLDFFPVKFPEDTVTVTLQRGASTTTLAESVDWFLNPADGVLYVPAPSLGGILIGDIIRCSYTYFTGLIAAVQKVLDGDEDDRLNFPGYRAAGVLVRALSPTVVSLSIQATLTMLDGFDQQTVIADCVAAVQTYVNSLGISGDVIRAELVDRIMETDGVYDVNLVAPIGNLVVLDEQIARVTTANINIS